jgi:hypothetical protein
MCWARERKEVKVIRNNKGIAFSEVLVVLAILFCLFCAFIWYKRHYCCPYSPVMSIDEQAPRTPEQVLYKEE